jgi:hypothetical protein
MTFSKESGHRWVLPAGAGFNEIKKKRINYNNGMLNTEICLLPYALCAMLYSHKPATRLPPAILPVAAVQHMHDLY